VTTTALRGVEYGDARRRGSGSAFPESWGIPRGSQHSEERAAWIRSHIPKPDPVAAAYRRLAAADARLTAIFRLAEIERRRL
jgi:hypothetical protein